ncbi:MAG: PEP-CTERM sorting domain-containing protein [Planctomycetaceae bacterium]|nr:PEP-CTERM sorting domain-containing protein [Planctomycetaceae bacterium]
MRKMLSQVVPFLLLAAMPLTSFAAVTDLFKLDGTKNEVKFINREVFMRQVDNEWQVIDPRQTLDQGDVLVTLFTATTLSTGAELTNSGWLPGDSNGYLLGYAAQTVQDVSLLQVAGKGFSFIAIDLGNVDVDPFGVLNSGEQVAVFNSSTEWVVNGADLSVADSVQQSLANAVLWEKFMDGEGGSANFAQTSGVVTDNGSVFVSAQYGLTTAGESGLTFVPTDWLNTGAKTDVAGRANADLNDDFGSISPWMFDSQDPLVFAAVPEPATLAMWGGFLAIGAVVALRRRQK